MIDRLFYTIRPAISLADLAAELGVDLSISGARDEMIEIPADLGRSKTGSVSFFSNKRRKDQLLTAQATACLTTEKFLPLVAKAGMIGLVVDDPRAVFARLSGRMVTVGKSENRKRSIHPTAEIHPSANISDGVSIGEGSRIGANVVIEEGVTIGARCIVEPFVRIAFTEMGDDCYIKSGAVIGGSGFGMAEDENGIFSIPHLGRVILHNSVQIGSNSCVDRGQLGDTVLSDDVKVDNLVQIGHNVLIGQGTMIAGHAGISGSCEIGEKCLFGGRASLADHIKVGDGAIVAASAGVMSDIPSGEMYSGTPAMPIREHMRSVAVLKKLTKKK